MGGEADIARVSRAVTAITAYAGLMPETRGDKTSQSLAPARVSVSLLAQFEGDDERWSAKLHAPRDYRLLRSRSCAKYVLIDAVRLESRRGQMAVAKQLKAAILARRATSKGQRGKRTRPGPRQYAVTDLERARDRVAAAERRIDNDHKSNPNKDARGWSGRSSNYTSSSRNYACVASLSDVLDQVPAGGRRFVIY